MKFCNVLADDWNLEDVLKMTRSSAYRDPLIPVGSESRMGLMATIKHVALRTPPCGNPAVVVWFLERVFPIFTFIVLSLR